jgi:mannose-1-phosphate guanylyltransferase
MQALILVGGEGTRLRPLTLTMPKPVVPLADRPFIRFMIDWLARHDVDDVVVSCGFLAAGVRDVLGDGEGDGPRLRYVEEPEPRGTAGAMKYAERFLDDRFLALNGDVLTDLDLGKLIELHEQRGATATLALHPVDDPSAYGLVRRNEDCEITEFIEKPGPGEIDTDEINAGAYVLEKTVLDLVPEGREVSIEREVFPKLVGKGLYGRRLEGYWMDIGTPERYLQASWDILERRVETDAAQRLGSDGRLIEADVQIDGDVAVEAPAIVESRARLGAGARVGPRAVVGSGSEIGESATVEESVLMHGARVGAGAEIRGAILAGGVEVGDGASVAPGAVVGEGARIAPGAAVEEDARVQPGEEVT